MTSLWSWDLPWGTTAFPTVCLLGAPVLLDWSEIPIDSDMKSFRTQHQEFKSTFSSDDLPTSWYIRSSRAFVVIKLNGKLLTHPFSCFLPMYFWFRSFRKRQCFCALYCSLCIQKEINSRWILEIFFCSSLYSINPQLNRGLGFWQSHSKSCVFPLMWRYFCFLSEYFTHFVTRQRALVSGE